MTIVQFADLALLIYALSICTAISRLVASRADWDNTAICTLRRTSVSRVINRPSVCLSLCLSDRAPSR